MKKALLFLLLVPLVAMAQKPAAKKLSKQETVAYINGILQQSVGFRTYGISGEERVCTATITGYAFTPETVDQHESETCKSEPGAVAYHSKLSNIAWQNATGITVETEAGIYRDAELAMVRVTFSSRVRYDKESDKYGRTSMSDDLRYRDNIWLIIPVTRAESFKKALERLIEIAKEENKDPFGN